MNTIFPFEYSQMAPISEDFAVWLRLLNGPARSKSEHAAIGFHPRLDNTASIGASVSARV